MKNKPIVVAAAGWGSEVLVADNMRVAHISGVEIDRFADNRAIQ
jgi:hypothetical protein